MDLQIRREMFGSNAAVLPDPRTLPENFLHLLWNAAANITLLVLIAAIVISFALSFLSEDTSSLIETCKIYNSPG